MNMQQWSLRGKIVLLGILLPTILLVILFKIYIGESRTKTVNAFVDKARAICLTAESTRQEMERKWELGIFDVAQLKKLAAEGKGESVLAMVPVVTAWNAAMRKAEEGGYTFRVPKHAPRKATNAPDAIETEAIKQMADNSLSEYFVIDQEKNAVRYFRPVKLTKPCLYCHGDPALSKEYWGNSDGRDATGGPMENWKEGEIHGAFEVVQSLTEADQQLNAVVKKGAWVMVLGLGVMAVFFGTLVLGIISNSVIKPIGLIIKDLQANASNLLEAAAHVSSSSNQLADGAQTQASSLEETSASLEEVSSMSRANADSVSQAADKANEAKRSAEEAQASMAKMKTAISSIKASSDQTATIMKTIDEIAFQTNLLALNAAVEAARAGEAGAGFAVVAEEVRSLALRSAEAARNTASLIEESQGNADNGVQAADEVAAILATIVANVTQVSVLASEITVASQEQSLGVNQINLAINEVDKVTQSNAAISEEAASASEELNGQAQALDGMVQELAAIVGVKQS
jgi:methyl-accepting chemotaxis protein